MTEQSIVFDSTTFHTGFDNYNTDAWEGLQAFWNDDDYVTHIRGMIKGGSIVANLLLDVLSTEDVQMFPHPATEGVPATGVGVAKLGPAYRPILCSTHGGIISVQADISGTLSWAQISITYQGQPFTPPSP
jgi:hypothetical protein